MSKCFGLVSNFIFFSCYSRVFHTDSCCVLSDRIASRYPATVAGLQF